MMRIADFITQSREAVIARAPELAECFDTYANEARFGFSVIESDIQRLANGAKILEVGAGMLLLSGYLASLGYRVFALEPLSRGFSHFHTLQQLMRTCFVDTGIDLQLTDSTIEEFSSSERFDFVFSINVFEHIGDVEQGLRNAFTALKPEGVLHIYCPNYHFPYEPHFNIPTLIDKRLTEMCFRRHIVASATVPEGQETWEGLNWITVSRVRRTLRRSLGVDPEFNRCATYQLIERMFSDAQFRERRSTWMATTLALIKRWNLAALFRWVPVAIAPVMDFRVRRLKGGFPAAMEAYR